MYKRKNFEKYFRKAHSIGLCWLGIQIANIRKLYQVFCFFINHLFQTSSEYLGEYCLGQSQYVPVKDGLWCCRTVPNLLFAANVILNRAKQLKVASSVKEQCWLAQFQK